MNKLSIAAVIFLLTTLTVSSTEEIENDSVPAGTGIGQIPKTDEVTRLGNNPMLAEYLALDKGNVWTYNIKTDDQTKEHTQSVVSESEGWSVFDNFFGMQGVSFRIAPEGKLFVTHKGAVRSFYNDEVTTSFPEEAVETPGGKFEEVMLVTKSEDDAFWFRDVYVKGVGLVFHEHKTPKGVTTYSLVKAKVRGKDYPPE